MIKNILKKIAKHKIISVMVLLLVVVGIYFSFKALSNKEITTNYTLVEVTKGTIVSSVSGSGQIEAKTQTDIKPEVSGDIKYFNMTNGQSIVKGAILATIDDSDAKETIQNAQKSLDDANLTLKKMQGMTTDEGFFRGDKEKAQTNLDKAYEDGFNDVSGAFLELPAVISGLRDIIYLYTFSVSQWNIDYYGDVVESYGAQYETYRTDALTKYLVARAAYDKNFQDYKLVNLSSDKGKIEEIIEETYNTSKSISEAVKSLINLISLYQDKVKEHGLTPLTASNTHLTSLNTYTSTANSNVSSLLSYKNSIQTYKEAVIEVSFDLDDQEDNVVDAQKTLDDAKEELTKYTIYAPFSGTIASVSVEKGDAVSTATTLGSIITQTKIATISLNEVDTANVKVGQKATLTFDAIEDLSITGRVIEVDSVGTVSQGVVSYGVQISLDTQEESVKPGMTVSATIITEAKQNVLLVSSSAIKTSNGRLYVEIMESNTSTTPTQQVVETGISDDTFTEIVSGLKEGDIIVTKTSTGTSSKTNTNNNSGNIFDTGGPGGGIPGGASLMTGK